MIRTCIRGTCIWGLGLLLLWITAAVAHDGKTHTAPAAATPPAFETLFGGSFELVDHDGRTRLDKDFLGAFMLISFGYTDCPSICPNNLQNLGITLDELGDKSDRIQPVFVSIDPARDRPQVLKDYVTQFHPRLIGLTGTEAQIRAAAKAYRVHRRKVLIEGDTAEDYLVDHSSLTMLIGPDGKFITMFPNDTPPERMAEILEKHLSSGSS